MLIQNRIKQGPGVLHPPRGYGRAQARLLASARGYKVLRRLALALLLALPGHGMAMPVGTAFTYQGELRTGGNPANANFDMEFRLYDALAGGSQIGPVVNRANVTAANGLFSIQLDFGPAQFAGDRQWLEVRIKPAGTGSYETLSPRTEVTAAPYALGAVAALANSVTTTSIVDGTVVAADIDPAQVQRRVSGSCASGQFVRVVNEDGTVSCATDTNAGGTVTNIATGAGLTGGPITDSGTISVAPGGIGLAQIDATQVQRRIGANCPAGEFLRAINEDGTVACSVDTIGPPAWGLAGNAGTDPLTQFIGTTDAQPLVLRTRNTPSLRLEPSVILFTGLPITSNTIAGSSTNGVASGIRGGVIGGGGAPLGDSDPSFQSEGPNEVTGHYGTVSGGMANRAGNLIPVGGAFTTVAGGRNNTSSGESSTIGGGEFNETSAYGATISGGLSNVAVSQASTIGGGMENNASAANSTIGGGLSNVASGQSSNVGGGRLNVASGENGAIGGGRLNVASGLNSTVAGGFSNEASADYSLVSGGFNNTASNLESAVGGGGANTASGQNSTVSGGFSNSASGDTGTVGGGAINDAAGYASTVAGGTFNCAGGRYSWAGGNRAKVRPAANPGNGGACAFLTYPGGFGDEGSFVWADSQQEDFLSTGPNQFLVRAFGGAVITAQSGTRSPVGNMLRVVGTVRVDALGSSGSTALCRNANNQLATCSSSARYKRDIGELELGLTAVLRLNAVDYRWKDTGEPDIGFVAEEIAEIDARLVSYNAMGQIEGVKYDRLSALLANAVQELAARDSLTVDTLAGIETENQALRAEVDQLRALSARQQADVEALRDRLARLEARMGAPLGTER